MKIKSILKVTVLITVIFFVSSPIAFGKNKRESAAERRAKKEKVVQDQLLKKLSFLYACNVKEYKFQCLNEEGMFDILCIEYGISGCGNKFIYTKMGSTWILTSSNLQGLFSSKNIDPKKYKAESSLAMQTSISQQSQNAAQVNMHSMMAANQAAMAASQAAMAASQAAMMAATPAPQ